MDESLLGALDPARSEALLALGRPRHYPAGTTLFNEGETSDRVAVLREGLVKISFFTDEGSEVLLSIRGPGSMLGDMSALDGEPRSATVTALTPVDALVIATPEFRSFLISDSEISLAMLTVLSARLRDADKKRIEFGSLDTTGRVAMRLLELADRFGKATEDGVNIAISLSQQDLAGWTGSSREAVSKALQGLRTRKIVRTDRKQITILDRAALERRTR